MGSGLSTQAVVLVGAGPAALAPLFAAANVGRLPELLRAGVTVLEQSAHLGVGTLDRHGIRSDSSAEAFLDIVMRTEEPRLQALRQHPVTLELASFGSGPVPLRLAALFLQLAGETVCDLVAASPRGMVLTRVVALSTCRLSPTLWRTRFRSLDTGVESEVDSTSVVLGCGARQDPARLSADPVAGHALLPRCEGRLLQSGEVLSHEGVALVTDRLRSIPNPRIAVVGGSTSAGAVATSLLYRAPELHLGPASLTLLHREPLRIFYNSVEEARAEGYAEFAPQDVCSLTGRVFRLSGFRFDSRELIMSVRGIGGRTPEPRVSLFHLNGSNNIEAWNILDAADLVIAALGYRPRLLPVTDATGNDLPLFTPHGHHWSVIDAACRVLDSRSSPLDGLFAIGLAVGPGHTPDLGGEARFTGQVNSLWVWQHTLGLRIVEGIFDRERGERERAAHYPVKSFADNGSSSAGQQPQLAPVGSHA